jgi:hypothetical protein
MAYVKWLYKLTKNDRFSGRELLMKELTLKLDDKELQMLQEITKFLLIEKKKETLITNSKMNESIRALILIFYMNEIVPVRYGKNAVVTIEENI